MKIALNTLFIFILIAPFCVNDAQGAGSKAVYHRSSVDSSAPAENGVSQNTHATAASVNNHALIIENPAARPAIEHTETCLSHDTRSSTENEHRPDEHTESNQPPFNSSAITNNYFSLDEILQSAEFFPETGNPSISCYYNPHKSKLAFGYEPFQSIASNTLWKLAAMLEERKPQQLSIKEFNVSGTSWLKKQFLSFIPETNFRKILSLLKPQAKITDLQITLFSGKNGLIEKMKDLINSFINIPDLKKLRIECIETDTHQNGSESTSIHLLRLLIDSLHLIPGLTTVELCYTGGLTPRIIDFVILMTQTKRPSSINIEFIHQNRFELTIKLSPHS